VEATVSANVAADEVAPEQAERRADLHRRFFLAGLRDPGVLTGVPWGCRLFLLPDDDPSFAAAEIAAAARAAQRGDDVYLRHVRIRDLPK
jgi:hypothetical protein